MLSSKVLVVAFLLGASLTESYANTSDDDDDELTKKIKERYKALCNSNQCRENPGKPVKEVFDTEDGYVTIELSCPKVTESVCQDGYHDDGAKCEDIDECTNGTHNCSQNANCTNTRGSFNCTCVKGYHGDGVTCSDMDECRNRTHNCSLNAICKNTMGSFNCTCLKGYHGDGVTCSDMDECRNRTHNCSLNAICKNTMGSFNCTCLKGYHGDGVTCSDMDECRNRTHNCSQNASCTNTEGSFNCTCLKGYYGDGVMCKECGVFKTVKTTDGRCCVFPFTYRDMPYSDCTKKNHHRLWCAITSNYDKDKLWGNCVDIDECNDRSHKCSKDATCTNTMGSFECVCLAGYHGDGYTCKACGSDWQLYFNGSCYKYFNEEESWDAAKSKCKSYGASLASIHSSEENAFITRSKNHLDVWIGLNDKTAERNFTWIDGTVLDYTNWRSGEPNNFGREEDCVGLRVDEGLWNDEKCSTMLYYLCKL